MGGEIIDYVEVLIGAPYGILCGTEDGYIILYSVQPSRRCKLKGSTRYSLGNHHVDFITPFFPSNLSEVQPEPFLCFKSSFIALCRTRGGL